jgi:tRNA(Leu) C34 or U34 (ribose-2'-O)-methylase TrmL
LARGFANYPGGHNEGFPDAFKQCFRAFYNYIAAGDYAVFGSESAGLPQAFCERYRDDLYSIPMPGPHARSLNLANAAAVAAYEAFRQTAR